MSDEQLVSQPAECTRILADRGHRWKYCPPSVGVVEAEDRQFVGDLQANFVGFVNRPVGNERIGDKNGGGRGAETHHLSRQLCPIESMGWDAELELLVVNSTSFQRLAVRLQAIDVVAVVGFVGREGDSLVTQRYQVFDAFDAGSARFIIGKRQTGVIEMVAQNDCWKTLVANRAGNVAVGTSQRLISSGSWL